MPEGSFESLGLGVFRVGALWGQVLLCMPTVYLENPRAAPDEEHACPRAGTYSPAPPRGTAGEPWGSVEHSLRTTRGLSVPSSRRGPKPHYLQTRHILRVLEAAGGAPDGDLSAPGQGHQAQASSNQSLKLTGTEARAPLPKSLMKGKGSSPAPKGASQGTYCVQGLWPSPSLVLTGLHQGGGPEEASESRGTPSRHCVPTLP